MRPSGSAGRRRFRSRSGTSRSPASRTGVACRRWSPRSSPPAERGRHRGGYLRLHRLVQLPLGHGAALGPRRRHRQAARAARDPAAREAHPQGHGDARLLGEQAWQEISGPEAILIGAVQNPALLRLQGKTLAEIAKEKKADPIDALLDLLIEDKAYTSVAVFGMVEQDVVLALKQPWVSINNDSQGTAPDGILGEEHPHPRAYGTFPRILRKYVREEKSSRWRTRSGSSRRCRRSGCA